ncbi:MAG: beta-propeller domain-containing protein [Peptostreptococcaceae bacterium]|nr:beta-propeller domain-containing protein [Peptostreptococcaceae bacterium]
MRKSKGFIWSLISLTAVFLLGRTVIGCAETKVDLSGNLLLKYDQKIDAKKLYDNIKFEDEQGNPVEVLLTAVGEREVVVVPLYDMEEVKVRLVKGDEGCKIEKYTKQAYVGTKENLDRLSASLIYPTPYFREEAAVDAAKNTKESAALQSANESLPDFSRTNIQVEGIDEPDIVKTDGKYIYYLKEDKILIVETRKSTMENVSEITYEKNLFHPQAIYVEKDQLIVIGSGFEKGKTCTLSKIYDMKDRSRPKMIRELKQPGQYFESRKKESRIYLLSSDHLYGENPKYPVYRDTRASQEGKKIDPKEILIFPGCASASLVFISGTDLSGNAEMNMTSFVGTQETLFMSRDSLYLSYLKQRYYPMLRMARPEGGEVFNFGFYPEQKVKTNIKKFEIQGTEIKYKAEATIEGWLLNQFSMDEKEGYFRVAFTTDFHEYEKGSSLYIFDSNMKRVGKIENIAPKEKIHSVRFMGDRAYMVTFKNIDPFFVLDLKTPKEPKILGYLKIPGVSEYLHPYDENTVIGFGKDTINNSKNTAFYLGMKIAIFDVSDVSKPVEKDVVVIGDRGTESELIYNHKALMYDAKRGLMGFPISVAKVKKENKTDRRYDIPEYGEEVFQGAYLYKVSRDKLEEKGKITHFENFNPYQHDYNDRIRRLIYIGDTIYSLSGNKIMATDAATMKTLGQLEFK